MKKLRLHRRPSVFAFVALISVSGLLANGDTLELRVANATVPPSGTLQLQLAPTTPKPIVKGRQGLVAGIASLPILGSVEAGALFSPSGETSGFALSKGNSVQVSFNSSDALLGTETDGPTLVLLFPVSSTATQGETAKLALNPSVADWVDPSTGKDYAVTLTPGSLTVGGTLSIASVNPGGSVAGGTKIVIKGTGFQPGLKIKLKEQEVKILSMTVVSSSEVDLTLNQFVNLTGVGITITNPTNESVTYYAFQQTTSQGASTSALLRAAVPMFSTVNYTDAFFHPAQGGGTFPGIALQNTGTTTASIQLQLSSSDGVLGTKTLSLPADRYVVRNIGELFPGVTLPSSGSTLEVTTPATSVQMLGLIGDNSAKTVTPVDPLLMP